MSFYCMPHRPLAKIQGDIEGDAIVISNISQYDDDKCLSASRKARWVIAKNGRIVIDFGWKLLATPISLGTDSSGNDLNLALGAESVYQYLLNNGVTMNQNDLIQIGLFVQNCHKEKSKISNLYTLPPFGDCTDCCCDDGYVFQVGSMDYCAQVHVTEDFCLI